MAILLGYPNSKFSRNLRKLKILDFNHWASTFDPWLLWKQSAQVYTFFWIVSLPACYHLYYILKICYFFCANPHNIKSGRNVPYIVTCISSFKWGLFSETFFLDRFSETSWAQKFKMEWATNWFKIKWAENGAIGFHNQVWGPKKF